jgi:serine/threonine-protein kinase
VFLVHDPAVPGGERAKILDFGIAKLERADRTPSARTRTGAIMGTPKYMSPEQCRDSHDVDHRSDIYSLGCLLYCMVTGHPPFDYPSAAEVMSAHLKEDAPRASEIAALSPRWAGGLDAIIARCLAKDPAARFQRMADVARAIGNLLDEEPADAADEARSPTLMPSRSGPTLPTRTLSPPPPVRPPLRWQLPVILAMLAGFGGAAVISGRRIVDGPNAAGAETFALPVLRSTTIPADPPPPVRTEPAPPEPAPPAPAAIASVIPPPSPHSRTPTRARSSKEPHVVQTSATPELLPQLEPPPVDDDRPESVDRSD